MTKPVMTAQVSRYLSLKKDYLDLMGKLNTSYGHVSNINEGLYYGSRKSAKTSLIEGEAHISLIMAYATRAERYRRDLLALVEAGADQAHREYEMACWKWEEEQRTAS